MSWEDDYPSIDVLVGKTLTSVTINEDRDRIELETSDGEHYVFYHRQDCCESVDIESVVGDLQDLLNTPLLLAEEVVSDTNPEDIQAQIANRAEDDWTFAYGDDSFTWTFYRFQTIKGSVTIRWYGSSNGYYSEGVMFQKLAA